MGEEADKFLITHRYSVNFIKTLPEMFLISGSLIGRVLGPRALVCIFNWVYVSSIAWIANATGSAMDFNTFVFKILNTSPSV